jgi:hypothetical protein
VQLKSASALASAEGHWRMLAQGSGRAWCDDIFLSNEKFYAQQE